MASEAVALPLHMALQLIRELRQRHAQISILLYGVHDQTDAALSDIASKIVAYRFWLDSQIRKLSALQFEAGTEHFYCLDQVLTEVQKYRNLFE